MASFGYPSMGRILHATFADGAFWSDEDPHLPANARVRLTFEPLEAPRDDRGEALRELEKLWDNEEIMPGLPPLSRDQLHDRD